ncbi:MAG: SdrD B-like domain-containing protein, partial [Planctomycetota bacterium JB042]
KFVCDGPAPFPCGPTFATEVIAAEPGTNQGSSQDPTDALGDTDSDYYSLGDGGCLTLGFGAPFSTTGDAAPDLQIDEWNLVDCYTVLVEPLDAATVFALEDAGFTEDAPGSGLYAIFSGCSDQQIDIDSLVPGHGPAELAFGSVRICDDNDGSNGAEVVRVFAEEVCPGLIAKLGDRVWVDIDRDGLQDDGEAGLPNVPVTLRDAATDAIVDETTTDADGLYLFCAKPGSYVVEFTIDDEDFSFTTREAGGDPEVDSDPDESTGRTDPVTLDPGQVRLDIDAGVVIDDCVGTSLVDTDFPACVNFDDPVLTATVPNLGSDWTLTMTSNHPNSLYFVWGSIGPPVEVVIPGSLCSIWVDPFKVQTLMTGTTDANGGFEITESIPVITDWIGAELTFVARVCDPTTQGPILGFPDFFSNSLHIKLGCP